MFAKKLHPAFVAALEADREKLNQQFRVCSLQGAPIEPAAFFDHLAVRVDPIIAAVDALYPERTRLVTTQLYEVSLDLFRTGFWGIESRSKALDLLWEKVLPKLGTLVARDPQRTVGALSNAIINIGKESTARSDKWLEKIAEVARDCESVEQLLDGGRLLAWRVGMAQLRSDAMKALARLPRTVGALALLLPSLPSEAEWETIKTRLAENPWFAADRAMALTGIEQKPAPSPDLPSPDSLVVAHTVGGFRGFGGSFLHPPSVFLENGQLHVTDQESVWRIIADCYGWFLLRVVGTEKKLKPKDSRTNSVRIAADGTVHWGQKSRAFLHLSAANGQVFDGRALAITLPTSFHVFLIVSTSV